MPTIAVATQYAAFVQDQIELSPHWQALIGVRWMDGRERQAIAGAHFEAEDNLWSPRFGLIFKPAGNASIYASYSRTFVPRAGEQLASLTATNSALDPEKNGKTSSWARSGTSCASLSLTSAIYQLQRTNVAITNPLNATQLILVDGQEVRGVEIGIGDITEYWHVSGGYAFQDSGVSYQPISHRSRGRRLAQTPEHSFSL